MHTKIFFLFFAVLIQLSWALPAALKAKSSLYPSAAGQQLRDLRSSRNDTKGCNDNGHKKNSTKPKSSNILGATYFITNKANNSIVVSSIGADGKLTFAREVNTGGAGGSASGDADALFSQGSITQVDGKLFAVNAGDNTLSMFAVDTKDPTQLTPVGCPMNSGGEFPVAVAFSPKHNTACVVNSGGKANIACLGVSSKGLTALDTTRDLGIDQTNPPTGPANTVSDILFSHDESRVLVSVKGTPNGTVGFIASFDVRCANRSFVLSNTAVKSTPDKGVLPFGMTLLPSQSSDILFSTDAAFGASVSRFDAKSAKIISSQSVAIANQTATCWSAFSPRTGSFYVTDVGVAHVTEFSVDPNEPSLKLIATHPLEAIGGRIDDIVASTRNGDFLYVLAAKEGAVDVLRLDSPGKATQIQTFDAKTAVPDLPISVQGLAVLVL